jgi:hypothetical protein
MTVGNVEKFRKTIIVLSVVLANTKNWFQRIFMSKFMVIIKNWVNLNRQQ